MPRQSAAKDSRKSLTDPDAVDTSAQSDSVNAQMRAPLTVLVSLVPLGLIGEIYRFIGRDIGGHKQELLADPMLLKIGAFAGIDLPIVPVILLAAGCLIAQVYLKKSWKLPKPSILSFVLIWALIWGSVRFAIGLACHGMFMDHTLGLVGLALSGALQEELLFRCVLLGGLLWAGRIIEAPPVLWGVAILIASSVFFSLAHTAVVNHFPSAEPFAWHAFTERAFAGLLYGVIFMRQGLAVCTLSHAAYNMGLLFLPGNFL